MEPVEFEFTPFQIEFSFHRLIEAMQDFIADDARNELKKNYFRDLLQQVEDSSVLLNPIIDTSFLVEYESLIQELFEILFPIALSSNEIKGVSMPFQQKIFNHTKRFKNIIAQSGGTKNLSIRNFNQHEYFIASCCIIMNFYFNTNFDLTQPLFVDLPDEKGIIRHYRVLYNADFVEVIPTDRSVMLSKEEIELLEDNYQDLDLWRKYFPQKSWILKGFGIISLIDVTVENALSILKENLLKTELKRLALGDIVTQIFSSILRVPNLRVGFTSIQRDSFFRIETTYIMGIESFLYTSETDSIELSQSAYESLVENKMYYSISDVEKSLEEAPDCQMLQQLYYKGAKSCLFAPLVISTGVEGVLEIVSDSPRMLHSVNAQKLDSIVPIITETFERVKFDLMNQVEAIIQREFTTIHPSVYWKFLEEAYKGYVDNDVARDYNIKPIAFPDVYPLYAEIDIKGSSKLRNEAIISDLAEQLEKLLDLFLASSPKGDKLVVEKHTVKIIAFQRELEKALVSGLEQRIETYIKNEIHPYFEKETTYFDALKLAEYLHGIDGTLGIYYKYRKIFDEQVGNMNKMFSNLLDKRQVVAQKVYPHYYERFKTDGVEHNIYIGNSISPGKSFDTTYLQNIRLWQLQIMIESMCAHYQANKTYKIPMDVTELMFVFDSPLGIQFRMDEKRFDIDGVYNTRYEIIKKRLDKVCIKGTTERIVQSQKLTIAFASSYDIAEYLNYINYAQALGMLNADIEQFDIEDMQSVSGLKGIRVSVNINYDLNNFDYEGLMRNYLKFQYL